MDISATQNGIMSRFAEEVEVGSMHVAEEIRKRFRDCLHEEDDGRQRTVVISQYTPATVKDEIGRMAAESFKSDRFGMAELTEFEKDQIDFTETNIFHAQACKAIALGLGETDWLAYYDTRLTVDEHRDIYRREVGSGVTMRDIPAFCRGGRR